MTNKGRQEHWISAYLQGILGHTMLQDIHVTGLGEPPEEVQRDLGDKLH